MGPRGKVFGSIEQETMNTFLWTSACLAPTTASPAGFVGQTAGIPLGTTLGPRPDGDPVVAQTMIFCYAFTNFTRYIVGPHFPNTAPA